MTQGKGASRRLRHAGQGAGNPLRWPQEPRAITLDHQKLMTLIDNEKFYSSIIKLEGRRQEAGRDRQGPADAPGAQRHRARRPAARRRDREDPHPHPDSLQGRGRSPGREDRRAASCRTASRTWKSPACRRICPSSSSWISRRWSMNESKHLSDLPLPEGVTIPSICQGRIAVVVSIHPPRAEEPEPTAEAAAATPAEGAAAAPAEGAAAAGAKAGDAKAAAAAMPRRRPLPPRRKAARSKCRVRRGPTGPRRTSYCCTSGGAPIIRRAAVRFASRYTWPATPLKLIVGLGNPGRRIRAHAPQRRLLARG